MDGFLIILAIIVGMVFVAIISAVRGSSTSRQSRASTWDHHDPNVSMLGAPLVHDASSSSSGESNDDRYVSYGETGSGDCGETGWDSGGDASGYDSGGGSDGGCSDGGSGGE